MYEAGRTRRYPFDDVSCSFRLLCPPSRSCVTHTHRRQTTTDDVQRDKKKVHVRERRHHEPDRRQDQARVRPPEGECPDRRRQKAQQWGTSSDRFPSEARSLDSKKSTRRCEKSVFGVRKKKKKTMRAVPLMLAYKLFDIRSKQALITICPEEAVWHLAPHTVRLFFICCCATRTRGFDARSRGQHGGRFVKTPTWTTNIVALCQPPTPVFVSFFSCGYGAPAHPRASWGLRSVHRIPLFVSILAILALS